MKKGGKREYIREILCSYPAIRTKSPEVRTRNEQRRFEAVSDLLAQVDRMEYARNKKEFIEMVYFKRTHNICGAALRIPVGERTALRWNAQVIALLDEILDLP